MFALASGGLCAVCPHSVQCARSYKGLGCCALLLTQRCIGPAVTIMLPPDPMSQFVLLVHDVVAEKEGRARQMMEVMGLR